MRKAQALLKALARIRWLPLWIMTFLLVLGLVLEGVVHNTPLWISKLPLAALLASFYWSRRRC